MTPQRMDENSHLLTVTAVDSLRASGALSALGTQAACDTVKAGAQLREWHFI